MDNLTHSFTGAALAELALPPGATKAQRTFFMAAGVLAANLPDLDLVYVGITPAPLGYLLHHRGHTHTVVGLLVQAVILASLSLPFARRRGVPLGRLWALMAAGLVSHILLDAGNSYGVHPFHPFDRRWYYGDAVFIFEPWLWLLLGVPAAMSAPRRSTRIGVLAVIAALIVGLTRVGVLPAGAVAALVLGGFSLAAGTRRISNQARAACAVVLAVVLIGALLGASRVAKARTLSLLTPVAGQILDIVLNPDPGNPICWTFIAIRSDEAGGEYGLRRGILSLAPRWIPPTRCASHRFLRPQGTSEAGAAVAWDEEIRRPLEGLRELSRRDCWVRAWLQFGRAPLIRDGAILDLRFDNGGRGNFTAMRLRPEGDAATCPAHVTTWAWPRADLLEPAAGADTRAAAGQ